MSLLSRAKLSGSALSFAASLQQQPSYSTSKLQNLTYPNSRESSSSSTGDVVVRPKPREIPYQPKVANFVNLIGYVKAPIQFDAAKNFVSIVISQEVSGGKDKDSLLVAVVFEGDLAHVVANHVKENDFVQVSGMLNSQQMHFKLSASVGTPFHVVGEDLNFVERNVGWRTPWGRVERKVSPKKPWVSGLGVGNPAAVDGGIENDGAKTVIKKTDMKKKQWDLWLDLLKNTLHWRDYRDHKVKGIAKENHPDFKHKETGDELWVHTAPDLVLHRLGNLEFDVQTSQECAVRRNSGAGEDSWKNLIENPSNWLDNTTNKPEES